jgi:hypothetical protein
VALLTLGTLVVANGCTGAKRVGPIQTGNWAYSPHTVEIHPLSRFKNPLDPDKETLIMVHVEFKDGDGFACRGVGPLDVSLFAKNGRELATENVQLQDEDVNFTRFDPVTRTYQVRFNHVPSELERVSVKVRYFPNGQRAIESQPYTIHNNR